MTDFPRTLILITTYRCNMRCGYCPVEQSNEDMSMETALLALEHFFANADSPGRVRFFGGEPLLNFEIVRGATRAAENFCGELSMDLTTNGTLLDDETIRFFEAGAHFELIVSIDGQRETHCSERHGGGDGFSWVERLAKTLSHTKNVSVNKVISPANVLRLPHDFAYIRKLGFSRINLLPAYYNYWPPESLAALNERLDKLVHLIGMMEKDGFPVSIRNVEFSGELPLFNSGMVVDTDGKVYAANHIMYRELRGFRSEAVRTDVRAFNPEALAGGLERERELIAREVPREILNSTRAIDAALSRFVAAVAVRGRAGHSGPTGDSSSQPMS